MLQNFKQTIKTLTFDQRLCTISIRLFLTIFARINIGKTLKITDNLKAIKINLSKRLGLSQKQ